MKYLIILLLLFSCSLEKKNISDIKIHQNIDEHFSEKQIKKYTEYIGLPKPQIALNFYNPKRLFKPVFDHVQIIFNKKTRKIYTVAGGFTVDPDKCLELRKEKEIEFQIFMKDIEGKKFDLNETNYVKGTYNRLESRLSYDFENLRMFAALTCYDNRNAYTPTGKPFEVEGELRFSRISYDYKLK